MRKNCTPGSVRGAARKGGSYRGAAVVRHDEVQDLESWDAVAFRRSLTVDATCVDSAV